MSVVLAMQACNGSSDTQMQSGPASRENVAQVDHVSVSGPITDEPASAPITEDVSQIVNSSAYTAVADSAGTHARFATAGKIDSHAQRPGNPEAGRTALLEKPYVNCGIPERVYRQLTRNVDIVELDGRADSAAGLPYSVNIFTNDDDVNIVSNNCLACHGTQLFGELVIGLGNEFLDFTTDASVLVERAGALVRGDAETRAWELYADRINAISAYIRPHTVGANPANNLTFALIAHRHAEDNAWSDVPLLPLPPTDVPPVSVPPWWRMAKKTAMFNMGEGRLDHARIMMAASMLCSDTLEELELIDQYAPDIRAYIASLTPPKYPFAVDQAIALEGRKVFSENCSSCHGVYEAPGSYPARLVPIDTIQTDSTLIDFAHGHGVAYIDWFNRSFYGQISTAAPGPGYVAPPLDGIWASAPFLHNGSVPTIALLLDSAKRPAYWRLDAVDASDPQSFDQIALGWKYSVLPKGKSGAHTYDSRTYDTSLPGYSNAGHRFGDHLTESQRSAVLEYLKTL